jgi:hypothetical protein
MIKRISLVVVFAIGVIWIAATFIFNLWGKTKAVDNLTDSLRPAFSNSGVAQEQKDVDSVNGVVTELKTVTIPFLATTLKTTPAAVTTTLASTFPAVKTALGTTGPDGNPYPDNKTYLEHAAGYLTTVVTTIKSERGDYNKADTLVSKDISTVGLAWLFLILGVVVLVVGVLILARPGLGRPLAAVTALLGVVVIVVTYVLNVPVKTQGVDNLTNAFRPVFAKSGPLSIDTGAKYLAGVRAADVELETKVIPALPGLLGLPAPTVVSALKTNSPLVSDALLNKDPKDPNQSVLAGILTRFDVLAAKVEANRADFKKTDSIPGFGWPTTTVQLLLVGPAILLILAGVGLFLSSATRKEPR